MSIEKIMKKRIAHRLVEFECFDLVPSVETKERAQGVYDVLHCFWDELSNWLEEVPESPGLRLMHEEVLGEMAWFKIYAGGKGNEH